MEQVLQLESLALFSVLFFFYGGVFVQ